MSPDSRELRLDATAASADSELPAFLARPTSAPVYHGFPVIAESETDGWMIGVITEFLSEDGCDSGDAFVVAPDGSRAGLVWSVGNDEPAELCEPTPDRWGVYAVSFPHPIQRTDDLIAAFRSILPNLRTIYERVRGSAEH